MGRKIIEMEKWKWSGDERFVREPCDITKLSFEKDRDYGFSWPQRNYRCSFCKKEFKSAQALGGHMNVHRRDRARMRLSSPNSLLDSPNPNPNFPSLSPSAAKVSNTSSHSSFSCVSKPAFPASADQELHLGTVTARKQRTGCFPFVNVPVIELSQACDRMMESCGGDRGKKNKGAVLEVGIRKDARMLKTSDHDGFMRLDLSIGDHANKDHEDLDLELRLGYC